MTTAIANPTPAASPRLDDLASIIAAYNEVTEKLQHSHEALSREVVRLQRELASTNAQLQRSKRLAALGEMAAGIAHEIRNPLAAIQLYVDMLRQDLPANTGPADLAQRIAQGVRGMESIVTDVLSFAREINPRRRELNVVATLTRAADAHCRAAANPPQLVIDAAEELTLSADADLLHQVLLNLVRNADEALAGQAGGVIRLSARRRDAFVELRVADNGSGIAEDDIDRIFNPFFTTRHTGTGLGLAIVHRIVDAHAGSITAHNDPAGGAVFTLTLPAQPAQESDA